MKECVDLEQCPGKKFLGSKLKALNILPLPNMRFLPIPQNQVDAKKDSFINAERGRKENGGASG